jgi:hypothetical protein
VSQDFLLLGFFHESVSPQPQSIPLIFSENSLRYSEVKVHYWYQQHQWQICHWYQRHWQQIFPPVSIALLIPMAKFAAGVNDTGGKFATGVDDASSKLSQVSMMLTANLPPV